MDDASPLSLKLRPAGPEDAALIARLHVESWRSAYRDILSPDYLAGPIEAERLETWRGRLAEPSADRQAIVAEREGEALGFICVFADADPRWGSLVDNLHVVPTAKGAGVGAALLRAGAAWSVSVRPDAPLYLWVFERNTPAQRFYDRMGGQAVERALRPTPDGQSYPGLRYAWADPRRLASG